MELIRRRFLCLTGAAAVLPIYSRVVAAQGVQSGPKLTQILRSDLKGQGEKVQETVVNVLEMGPGASKGPRHSQSGREGQAADDACQKVEASRRFTITSSPT